MVAVWILTLIAWGYDHLSHRLGHNAFYRKQRTLIHDIDHEVIREECRQLLAAARAREATTRFATLPTSGPARIRTPGIDVLQPRGTMVSDGVVILSFGGGFHGSWLHFYEDPGKGRGTKDLGGGLWFVDEFDRVPAQ
jgi:hypothetical protein